MDHRAIAEARQVNDTHDEVLRYVGGSISPEMEIPKLLWLKRHLPSTCESAGISSISPIFFRFAPPGRPPVRSVR